MYIFFGSGFLVFCLVDNNEYFFSFLSLQIAREKINKRGMNFFFFSSLDIIRKRRNIIIYLKIQMFFIRLIDISLKTMLPTPNYTNLR